MPTTQASTGGSAGRNGNDGFLAADEEHVLADAGAHASTATSVRPTGSRSGVTGWSTSSLWPASAGVLDRRDDVADDARDLHGCTDAQSA